jgi:hypothetical protein
VQAHAQARTHARTHTHTHTQLAPAILPLLEAPLEGCYFIPVEPAVTFCDIFLHVKTMTFVPITGCQEEPKFIYSETWRIERLAGMVGIWLVSKNCCTVREMWQCTQSQCRIQLLPHFPALSAKQHSSYASELRHKKWNSLFVIQGHNWRATNQSY